MTRRKISPKRGIKTGGHKPDASRFALQMIGAAVAALLLAVLLILAVTPAKAETDPGYINAGWGGVVGGVLGCMMFGCHPDYGGGWEDRDRGWGGYHGGWDRDRGGWNHDHGDHGDGDRGGDHGGHDGHGGHR